MSWPYNRDIAATSLSTFCPLLLQRDSPPTPNRVRCDAHVCYILLACCLSTNVRAFGCVWCSVQAYRCWWTSSVFPCTSVAGFAFGTVRTRAQTTLFRRRRRTSPHCSARVCRQCAPFFIPRPCCAGQGCPFKHHYKYTLLYSIQRERKRGMEVWE